MASSSVIPKSNYDVFLSFRGEDTRDNFTSHLFAALRRKQIKTFIDYDGLKRGHEISPVLLKAIEGSKISVIIFSEDYASSSWCLDELAKILECKKMNGQMVVPVFYHVNPSDIRKQTGSFEDAFVKHEERFKEMLGKVQKWRDALTEAANLSGCDSTQIWPESKLVDEIVGDILKKLDATSAPSDCKGLVGLDSKVEHIKSLLCISSSDFQVVGIWGMGGIGKTTIVEVVFNQIRGQFEGCCFIRNVREESEKTSDGLGRLKEQLLSKILGESINIDTLNVIPTSIKQRVQRTKVLVVLDDVSNLEQLKILNGGIDQFCPGSRVIITTRDKQIFCGYEEAKIYEVKELNYEQAFQLFSSYAFKQNHPFDLVVLSKEIIGYTKGNPLALRVLGSSLCNKGKQVWESALNKLRRIPNPEIYKTLRISYNLLDREEQNLFLDIACLFKGENNDYAIKILDRCYSGASVGLDALIDKSLVIISKFNTLEMHDLLQDMGREIVQEEDLKDPGKRSRLWNHEDIYPVLKKNTGTNKVEAIFLDMSKIKDVHLSPRVFANMKNLKFLKFYTSGYLRNTVHIPKGLKYLPDELSYLHWDRYPFKTLASKFSVENLVKLDLQDSKLEKLWKEAKHAPKLRFINLNYSRLLTEIPNLSFAPQLEIIDLDYCESLLEISSSIQCLHNLRVLNLGFCKSLRKFQSNIHFKSLETLNLWGCHNLIEFPDISGHVEVLDLSETGIEEVPSSIRCLSHLQNLWMTSCRSLRKFQSNIHFKSLKTLNLWGCHNLIEFPDISGHVEELDLTETGIEEVPSSIQCLSHLEELRMRSCKSLRKFQRNIHFKSLTTLRLENCINLTEFPNVSGVIKCLHLDSTSIEEVPSSIKCLPKLCRLYLTNCKSLKSLPTSICMLKDLEGLYLSNCPKLEFFPEILERMEHLEILDLSNTAIKELPSSIENLNGLKKLYLRDCNLLRIPEEICSLSTLITLDLSGNSFESLPTRLKQLSNLEDLYLSNCDMLQSIPELPLSLINLEANNCKQLQSLTMLPSSSSLEEYHKVSPITFSFINCMKLNLEWADPHLIQRCYGKLSEIIICLPGSEIPDWFS